MMFHRPLVRLLRKSPRSFVVSLLFTLLLAAPVASQIVIGRAINDSSDAPIAGVTIALLDGLERETVSNAAGEFAIAIGAPGSYSLRASRIGYDTALTRSFEISPGEVVELELRLATKAVELEALTVVARRRETQREHDLRELYERAAQYGESRLGSTQIYTRVGLAGWDPFSLSDLFEIQLQWRPAGSGCNPRVFVDGRRLYGPFLQDIGSRSVASLEGIELYAGGGPSQSRFWDPQGCGVVLVWTRWLPGDAGGLDALEVLALVGGAALLVFQALGLLF